MGDWRKIGALACDAIYLASFWLAIAHHHWWAYVTLAGVLLGLRSFVRVVREDEIQVRWFGYPLVVILPFYWTWSLYRVDQGTGRELVQIVRDRGQRSSHKKAAVSIGLLVLLGLSATNLLGQHLVDPVMHAADEKADQYLTTALINATAAYGSARALDRVISMVTETTVSGGVGVAGASMKPGMRLKPLQDLLERFSEVMLWAIAALVLQHFLVEVVPLIAVPVLLSVAAVLLMIATITTGPTSARFVALTKLVIGLWIFLRVLLPLGLAVVAVISGAVLEDRQDRELQEVAGSVEELEEVEGAAEDGGVIARARAIWDSAGEIIGNTVEFSERMIGSFIQLLVVFLLQSVLVPIAVLLLLWKGWKIVVSDPHAQATASGIAESSRSLEAERQKFIDRANGKTEADADVPSESPTPNGR
ncbi:MULTISPECIES: hypothetical protein [unclassified Thioalkalivibrio]|uniref:hypothetical protein n=1 Tax=unclassified Thioalkalivibrio TaxID=2621013 RepID=UPI000365524F|nr:MULTISPECIES: hypothetical protein [unclassified Thioalkalivibrio]